MPRRKNTTSLGEFGKPVDIKRQNNAKGKADSERASSCEERGRRDTNNHEYKFLSVRQIIAWALHQGMDGDAIKKYCEEQFGMVDKDVNELYEEVLQDYQAIYARNLKKDANDTYARLQALSQELYAQGKYTQFMSCIDMMNKMAGAYREVADINISDTIKIEFQ